MKRMTEITSCVFKVASGEGSAQSDMCREKASEFASENVSIC